MFKKAIGLTGALLALVLTAGFALAAGAAGGAGDPLVTKSYVDGTFSNNVLSLPLENLSDTFMGLQYKIKQSGGGTGVTVAQAAKNGVIKLIAGSGLTLVSGSGTLASCAGTVIDLTDGKALSTGASIPAGHRLLAAENTSASVSLTEASQLAIYGSTSYGGTAKLSFEDVPEGAWYYNDVLYAVQKGFVSGWSATTYAPGEGLTVAEAIKLASCMNQLHETGSVMLQNGSKVWYQTYVDYALEKKLIAGAYADYNAKITRTEFIKIFYNALPESEYAPKNAIADNAIPDVKTTDANAKQIYAFYRAGILTGAVGGAFNPSQNVQRSEVAAIMTRMFDASARKSVTL